MSRTAQDIIEIGADLIAVRKSLGHGSLLPKPNSGWPKPPHRLRAGPRGCRR